MCLAPFVVRISGLATRRFEGAKKSHNMLPTETKYWAEFKELRLLSVGCASPDAVVFHPERRPVGVNECNRDGYANDRGQAEVSPLSCKTGRSLGCGWHLGDLGILEGDDLPLVLVLYHDQRGSGFYFAQLVAFLELHVRSGE